MNKKLSVISVCSTGLAVSSSQGALILNNFADISLAQGGPTTTAYYDFETATASTVLTAAHDYQISASLVDNNAFLVTSLNRGYQVLGGEFFTGGEYAGGEFNDGGGNQFLVRAFQTGDVIGGETRASRYGGALALTTESQVAGSNYDFSRNVPGGHTAIGFVSDAGGEGSQYGFVLAEAGSLVLLGGGLDNTVGTPVTVTAPPASVPEPGSLSLLAMGLLGISQYRRRRAS